MFRVVVTVIIFSSQLDGIYMYGLVCEQNEKQNCRPNE